MIFNKVNFNQGKTKRYRGDLICPKHKLQKKIVSSKFRCPECLSLRGKANYLKNKDVIAEKHREWREKNKQKISEYTRRWSRIRPPEYQIWKSMKQRCYNPNNSMYYLYGGRKPFPVVICDRWLTSFENFLADMGPRPSPRYSIERVDLKGNYEPGNCKWATKKEQANNTRFNLSYKLSVSEDELIDYQGEKISLRMFSEITGLHIVAIKDRFALNENSALILRSDIAGGRRKYEWRCHKYTLRELELISGIPYAVLWNRINRHGWSVDKALNE